MSIQQVGKHTYVGLGYEGSNLGCIVTKQGIVFVDTPLLPEDIQDWGRKVQLLSGQAPLYVINTHHHFDHLLGNGAYGSLVIAHESERIEMIKPDGTLLRYFITRRNDLADEIKEQIFSTPLVPPDITFKDKLNLHLGDVNIELRYAGGHCSSCILVHVLEDNILFTGDVVHNDIHPFMGQANFKEWMNTLVDISRLGFDVIVPGHGGLSGRDEVLRMLHFLRILWNGVHKLHRSGKSRVEIMKEMHPYTDYYSLVPGQEHIQIEEFDLAIGRLYDEIATCKLHSSILSGADF